MGRIYDALSGRLHARLYTTDRARDFDHEHDRNVRIRQIYESIDRQPYQWVVVLVAGIGFFIDGYTLFASNVILPMIAYVYWHDDTSSIPETRINIGTLAGTVVGQIFFGIMADKFGRKKMYGFELLVIMGATVGVAMSSQGVHGSMDPVAWIIWWRIIVGVGVGADYPLSAVITSEFAPTSKRSRMLASVFFMQPLGQVCGNVVSLIVLAGFRSADGADPTKSVDQMWRLITGISLVPGVVALFFRLAIPETPRFISEIEENPIQAEMDATQLFGELPRDLDLEDASRVGFGPESSKLGHLSISTTKTSLNKSSRDIVEVEEIDPLPSLNQGWHLSKADIHKYFWQEGNWRTLFATASCWFLLDLGFYGVGLSNPQFLARLWGDFGVNKASPIWKTSDHESIYDTLMATSMHALIILNIGSFIGGLLLILFASRINRVNLQKYSFLLLALLSISSGCVFISVKQMGAYSIVLLAIAQVAFNFGPNSTTYMLPAEVFPTRYRATCHGISAATGKLGSILVQILAAYDNFGGASLGTEQTQHYGIILIILSIAMLLGAIVTHFWMPQVQHPDGKSRTLERLAMGRMGLSSSTDSGTNGRARKLWDRLGRGRAL